MANPFPRTTRSLRGEEGLTHLLFPAACALLLAVWALWLVRARFPVYVASEAARLEAGRAPVPIATQVGGRLRRVAVTVGQTVAPGDLLAELDAEVETRRLEEERARLAAYLCKDLPATAQQLRSRGAQRSRPISYTQNWPSLDPRER